MSNAENPYEAPQHFKDSVTSRQAYNIVTDVATGVNVRWKDNLFQAIAIFVCLVLGAPIGAVVGPWLFKGDAITGAVCGALAGLLIGLLGSGTFLMIYRGIQHSKGKHD